MIKNNSTCSYKGHHYLLPNIKSSIFINISSIKLTINQKESYDLPEDPLRFFISKYQLLRTLDIRIKVEEEENFQVHVYTFLIYKEGVENPIATETIEAIGSESINLSFCFDKQPLDCGCYFLLGARIKENCDEPLFEQVGENLCIPFRLLIDGRELPHPSISKAIAVRSKHDIERYGLFSPGRVKFGITLKEASKLESEFSVILYNDGWRSIDDAYHFSGKAETSLTFHLHNELAWIPGKYHAVIMHNQEPFAVATFDYKGKEKTPCSIHSLRKDDELYWMITEWECNAGYQWKRIQEVAGSYAVVSQLIRYARRSMFNQLCAKNDATRLCQNNYLAIKTKELTDARSFIMGLSKLLHFETDYYKSLNCQEWRNDILLGDDENNIHPLRSATEEHTITISALSVLCDPHGKEMLAEVEEAICSDSFRGAVILYDTPEAIDALLESSPRLARLFTADNIFHLGDPNIDYLCSSIKKTAEKNGLFLSPQAAHTLVTQLLATSEKERPVSWRQDEWETYVKSSIIPLMRNRLVKAHAEGRRLIPKDFCTIESLDIAFPDYVGKQTTVEVGDETRKAFEESLSKLNRMVGLKTIKESLQETFLLLRFNEQRRRLGLPAHTSNTHHMIFTGNPGTGKTSVAELIGKIFHSLGLLSKGEVIKVERKDLVKRYIGETEKHMKELLEKAQGNVLFIDEAYTLCDTMEDRKDFGHHVIEALLGVLTKPNPDMLIILAGYENEMERLMEMNQGLKGRFPHHFNFEDYGFEELLSIGNKLFQEEQFVLTAEASLALKNQIKEMLEHKDHHFSNARWIKQFITSGILPAMAKRIMGCNEVSNSTLFRTIEASDIAAAATKYPIPATITLKPRRMIGFRA